MAPKNLMEEPLCLIENVDGHTLKINEKAMQFLSAIDQPVVVIAIVGKYRTGKSYLMNKLAGRSSGFALGGTIQSKTKGIWMWCVPHPSKPEHTLVLLDTEGLGDVEKGDSKNDCWIFSLAVLLSSNFVFNSVGTIDQQAMEQLHYVTELTKLIQVKSSQDKSEVKSIKGSSPESEFKRVFPTFTWCVRDFCLELEYNGKEISANEYLTNSLKLKTGSSEQDKAYNLPRDCILSFFHTFRCFVFDRPANGRNLRVLDQLKESDLEQDFVEQAHKFCTYLYEEGQVKTLLGGIQATGKFLGVVTESYVKAILSGSVPCIENALMALSESENAGAVQDAVSKYENEMNEKKNHFPTETYQEFLNLHRDCEREALNVFAERSFNDEDQKHQYILKEKLENKMKEFCQSNEEASVTRCKALIKELGLTLESKLSQGEYAKPRGHKEFLDEKVKLIQEYNIRSNKGIKGADVLQEFLTNKMDIEKSLLQLDESMTAKEKELAANQAKLEAAEREAQIQLENQKKMEELLEIQRQSFEEHKQLAIKQTEEGHYKQLEEQNRLLQRKIEEMGYKQDIARLEQEVAWLRRNQKPRDGCTIS
ncbi:guanylate-binding protein 1-like [Discoglossus pictus]